jgi:hypothetical protein
VGKVTDLSGVHFLQLRMLTNDEKKADLRIKLSPVHRKS